MAGLMYLGMPRESFMPQQRQEDLAYQKTVPHRTTEVYVLLIVGSSVEALPSGLRDRLF